MLTVSAAGQDCPFIGAHRGGGHYAPENTLAGFALGARLGADLLELDVQMTADGAVVVIHDATVDRTTNGSGLVRDFTLAALRRLDAGSWFNAAYPARADAGYAGLPVPTLAEVLAWGQEHSAAFSIELKHGPVFYAGLEEAVIELVRAAGLAGRVQLMSFDHHAVLRAKSIAPEIATGAIWSGRLIDPVAVARAAQADIANQSAALLTREAVAEAHAAGLAVQCLANDPALAAQVAAMGVDILDTDYPDLIRAACRGRLLAPWAAAGREAS